MVPWRLSKRFLSEAQQAQLLLGSTATGENNQHEGKNSADEDAHAPAGEGVSLTGSVEAPSTAADSTTDSGPCQHVTEDAGELVFQRYCHVYKEGEWQDMVAVIVMILFIWRIITFWSCMKCTLCCELTQAINLPSFRRAGAAVFQHTQLCGGGVRVG